MHIYIYIFNIYIYNIYIFIHIIYMLLANFLKFLYLLQFFSWILVAIFWPMILQWASNWVNSLSHSAMSLRYVRWLVGLGETHRVWVSSSESIQKRVEYVFSRIHEWKFSGPDGPIRFFQIGKVYIAILCNLRSLGFWWVGSFGNQGGLPSAPPFNSEVEKAAYLKDIAPHLASVTPGFS